MLFLLRQLQARASSLLAALLALGMAGCINTDAAVFVEASIVDPVVTLQGSPAAMGISGSYTVKLHLGPRASGPSEVGLGAFTIMNASRDKTLIDVLKLVAKPSFPVSVAVDSDTLVSVSMSAEDNIQLVETTDALCQAGDIVISGALDDGLLAATINPVSEPFAPGGCP